MYEVIGKHVGKTWKNDKGQVYVGTDLHCTYEMSGDGCFGKGTKKFYFGNSKSCYDKVLDLKVGDQIEIYFNQYGRPESFLLVKSSGSSVPATVASGK